MSVCVCVRAHVCVCVCVCGCVHVCVCEQESVNIVCPNYSIGWSVFGSLKGNGLGVISVSSEVGFIGLYKVGKLWGVARIGVYECTKL